VRVVEAGQVVEVAVLAEGELGVGRARHQAGALDEGHGSGAHALEEASTARGEHESAA